MERAGHPGARLLRVLPAPGAAGPAMAEVTLADGGVYKGELKCEAPHGQGSCAWPDGSKYEGEWRSGKMHGKGAFQARQHTYVGAFFKVRYAGARPPRRAAARPQGGVRRPRGVCASAAPLTVSTHATGRARGQGQVCGKARARRARV